ncbi:mRNA cap guanine-N7 methyltransferase [Copidosoma floridanum]|uniref:mRNA cap guanine-N7 methyltransferase n=1 Tax=Copidosoma floridanum TaxID=29053 RepID=UPI0006C9497E|nr:mRNA cap guanine-N7 methyltransferase [Copidosoma floridanum]
MSELSAGITDISNQTSENVLKVYCQKDGDAVAEEQTRLIEASKKRSASEADLPEILTINKAPRGETNTARIKDHTDVVASHYNTLEEKGLYARNESRIVTMRNFNNWIKSMIINEYLEKVKEKKNYGDPVRVLDMCCGKGGDLLKWNKSKINYLICADIAEVSVEQCSERFKTMSSKREPVNFKAEFHAYDCSKVRLREKYKDPSMQLDLVSCQFAFHYSFESLPQAECMMKNASESLKPGGYFIGTIPNAYELVSRWQKSDDNKFGNDIYSIEFQCDKDKPPLFGAKYNFHLEGVVDCPEFLVYLPMFRKLALKYGLEMIFFDKFEDYYKKMMKDEKNGRMNNQNRGLLFRMRALETYPPAQGAQLVNNPDEFQHAKDYLQKNENIRRIGTLSKSEWEAITIYAVFAFQKMKTVWNAEGKPEYVKC